MSHNRHKGKHDHTKKSEALSDSNRLFHHAELKTQGATQTTTVTVTINDKDDCITSCFSGLAKCFKRGK